MELIVNNGKVVEPQIKAAIKKDPVTMTLTFAKVHEMIAQQLWRESSFLSKYKKCHAKLDTPTCDFTLTFTEEE